MLHMADMIICEAAPPVKQLLWTLLHSGGPTVFSGTPPPQTVPNCAGVPRLPTDVLRHPHVNPSPRAGAVWVELPWRRGLGGLPSPSACRGPASASLSYAWARQGGQWEKAIGRGSLFAWGWARRCMAGYACCPQQAAGCLCTALLWCGRTSVDGSPDVAPAYPFYNLCSRRGPGAPRCHLPGARWRIPPFLHR